MRAFVSVTFETEDDMVDPDMSSCPSPSIHPRTHALLFIHGQDYKILTLLGHTARTDIAGAKRRRDRQTVPSDGEQVLGNAIEHG